MRRLILALAASALVACGGGDDPAGPGPGGPGTGGTQQISMTGTTFSPGNVTIQRGTTVRWTNNDPFAHNTVGPNNAWNSGNLNQGQSFSRQFDTAGTFDYTCTLHPGMNGRIVVQ